MSPLAISETALSVAWGHPRHLREPSEHRVETPEDLLSEILHGSWPHPADRATGCHADPPGPGTDFSQLDSAAFSDHICCWH